VIAFAERLARLKRRFLELLEKDLEFRRAVVGMLELERILEGLKRHDEKFEEVLERLDRHEAELVKLREDFNKLGGEVAKLREDMVAGFRRHDEELTKLREDMIAGFRRHDEILEKHAQEIARLREDFNKMLGAIAQIQEEQRRLREGYERLEKRVGSLEEGQARLEKRVGSLEEGQARLEKRVGSLEEGQARLEKRMDSLERGLKSLESAMLRGFADLSKFAGITFEEFVRGFLTEALRSSGEIPEGAELKRAVVDGEEINIFLEDPLIVGEVTASAESVGEITKLLRKAELARARYSKEPKKIMIALTAKRDVAREIERIAEESGVRLVIGRVVG
jgi:exonuclease VII small subunit